MIKENTYKKFLAVGFIITLFIFFIKNESYIAIKRLSEFLMQDPDQISDSEQIYMSDLEKEYASSIYKKQSFINLNGLMAKALNMQGYYSNIGMYVTDNGYIVSCHPQTSTDYEYAQIMSLKSFLDEKGIHLLYVNEPTKYMDDSITSKDFGIQSYTNQNADLFLQRITDSGVNALDLREKITEESLNIYDMFYRTDHHWTTRSGLWASRKIAEYLNTYCGYSIDISLYDESNYTFTEWKNCWLGEQGRKIAATYVGLDDYTEIKPNFPTSYSFKTVDGLIPGTFDDFINEYVYNTDTDVYTAHSWHYSYSQKNAINNNADYGKILILGDSYAQVTEPFISLGVSEVDSLVLRDLPSDFSLREYINSHDYDTILICYAQFMIGAHDDPTSANYKMFTFD